MHGAYIVLNLLEDTSTVSLASCTKVNAAVGHMNIDEQMNLHGKTGS